MMMSTLHSRKYYLTANSDMERNFHLVLDEITDRLNEAYENIGIIEDGHALAQAGLKDGPAIVVDYLQHNEAGVAFDHIKYMINEGQLSLSSASQQALDKIELELGPMLRNE
jgi:hypothetical protein